MTKIIVKRIFATVPVLWAIVTLAFFMVALSPGSPFDTEKAMADSVRVALEAQYGLNEPLLIQYGRYLSGLFRGDLGPSIKYPGWGVSELILSKIPVSLELGLCAMLVALVLGSSAGIIAASRPNTCTDYLPMTLAMLGMCLPAFVLGPLAILVFGLKLQWFNVSGWFLPQDRILPVLTLGVVYAASIARLMRTSMIEVSKQEYMLTATAKGLSPARVYLVHGLRNALTPVVAYLGPLAAALVTGSFVIETVFNVPGLGRFFVDSALNKDGMMVLGTVIFYATVLIAMNLATDILAVIINPLQRFE